MTKQLQRRTNIRPEVWEDHPGFDDADLVRSLLPKHGFVRLGPSDSHWDEYRFKPEAKILYKRWSPSLSYFVVDNPNLALKNFLDTLPLEEIIFVLDERWKRVEE